MPANDLVLSRPAMQPGIHRCAEPPCHLSSRDVAMPEGTGAQGERFAASRKRHAPGVW
jgi:hypothetical protein